MPSWLYSGNALPPKGTHHLQFYDDNRSPSQKKVALGTRRKRVAKKLKRTYEDAYALGEYDPGTVNCRGAYRTSTVLADSRRPSFGGSALLGDEEVGKAGSIPPSSGHLGRAGNRNMLSAPLYEHMNI